MRSSNSTALKAALIVLSYSVSVSAFWRMPCKGRTGVARIDPLVSPGEIAEHAHAVHGGSGFSSTSKTADLLASKCTSCEVTQDKSAYWHPALYFKSADGKFTLVEQVGGMLAYYLLHANTEGDTKIAAFPKDFEMISGDTNLRNFSYPVPDVDQSSWPVTPPYNDQAFLRQAAVGFNCLHYDVLPPEGTLKRHTLPDKKFLDENCKSGIRFELMFPSCWNGKDVTSKDKKSHMAFPETVMDGKCPPGFPKRLPSLLYEVIWNTAAFIGKEGEFVISNGDAVGTGFHGDFIMGWDVDFLQQAVDTCTNDSGRIEDCKIFTLQAEDKQNQCKFEVPAEIAKEDTKGPMDSLPGNVAIKGPGDAPKGAASGTPIAGGDAKTTSAAGAAPSANNNDKPAANSPSIAGAVFAAKGSDSPAAAANTPPAANSPPPASTPPNPAPTPAPSAPPAGSNVQSIYSTEYRTQGNIVNEIVWIATEITVTQTQTRPTGQKHKHKRHMHKAHARSFQY